MQGREYEVARQRCFDPDMRRFCVTHLADHDDVGVRAEERFHDHREVHHLLVDLHLAQALLGDFDRVFCRPDFSVRGVQEPQHRVQCRRLARTRGSAYEKKTVRLGYRVLEVFAVLGRQAKLVDGDRLTGREDTHDNILDPAGRRDGRNAQLDVERTELLELDLAVLGLPFFGNIQVAHDLQARDDRAAIRSRHFNIRRKRAVSPEPDFRLRFPRIGLDMDVRGPLVVGIYDDLVDELDQFVVRRR